MCLPIDDPAMVCWLKSQVRVLEAWREEVATRPDLDISHIMRLERHYQWLTSEIADLETPRIKVA
ncbi:MAG: hypothetical protein AAGA72_06795 [Pseudomonadota bacterium]